MTRAAIAIVLLATACKHGARDVACRGGPLRQTTSTAEPRWSIVVGAAKEYTVASSATAVLVRAGDVVIGIDANSGRERFRRTIAHANEIAAVGESAIVSTLYEAGPAPEGVGVTYAGELIGLDARTGAERWRTAIPPHVDHFLVRGEDVLFSTSATGGRPIARAVRGATGAVAWTAEMPGSAELTAIAGNRGYVVADDVFAAIDLATGKQLWSQTIRYLHRHDGVAATAARVYAGPLFAFETRAVGDGRLLRTTKVEGPADYRAELLADRDRVLIATRKIYVHSDPPSPRPGDVGTIVIGIDADGNEIFHHDVAIGSDDADRRPASAFATIGDRLVAAVEDRLKIYSVCDVSELEVSLGARIASNLASSGATIYVVLAGGALVRIDVPSP